MEQLVDRAIEAGVDGIFALGTTGESPSLGPEFKRELIRRTCEFAAGRVPVLVGLIEAATSETVALAEESAASGATALVVTPPFYFQLDEGQIVQYVERLVPRLPLPAYYYHIPSRTRGALSAEGMVACLNIPGVVGLKDSSDNLDVFCQVVKMAPPNTALFWGPEETLVKAMAVGATGGIAGGTNLFPTLYVALYRAAESGDVAKAKELQVFVDRISAEIYSASPYGSGYIMGVKHALGLLGIGNGRAEEPLGQIDEAASQRIRRCIEELSRTFTDSGVLGLAR